MKFCGVSVKWFVTYATFISRIPRKPYCTNTVSRKEREGGAKGAKTNEALRPLREMVCDLRHFHLQDPPETLLHKYSFTQRTRRWRKGAKTNEALRPLRLYFAAFA